jgi:hypothetical protein
VRLRNSAFLILAFGPIAPRPAAALPAFARRYGVSCQACHDPAPALTAFGEQFAGNGFRMSPDEPPRDTVNTGDDLLWLLDDIPLAMRVDAYVRAYADGGTAVDFQTPWVVKVLSGAPISRKLSYYVYFLLFERGEVGGLEDAFIQVNDIAGKPVDFYVGQFQVSDPMFKRELRLMYDDYAVYRARVGDQPADLTYDRGLMATADFAGFTLAGQVLNGNGIGTAGDDRRLDDNRLKNFFGHLTRDVMTGLRLGVMGYRGQQEGAAAGGSELTNRLWMLGADGTVDAGPLQVNVQYVHREDDHPTFTLDEPTAVTDGGFAEVLFRPGGSRWYGIALYNRIVCSAPLLDVRLGGASGLRRYETVTGGAGYLVRRNFRLYGEVTGDFDADVTMVTVGFTTAF